MNVIQLNFINSSNDANNSSVVIFQQNLVANSGELPVAWKVIDNCRRGDHHPFAYPLYLFVSATDSFGNNTTQQLAVHGEEFEMTRDGSGCELMQSGSQFFVYTEDPVPIPAIGVINALQEGNISGNIYKGGNLLATATGIAPGKNAAFKFGTTIRIGVVSQIEQGQVMNAAILSQINTELNLEGIRNANIIMTGGGAGPASKPFNFTLVPMS